MGPRGAVLDREQWLDRHQSGSLVYQSFQVDDAEIRIYTKAAVAVCRQSSAGTYQDEDGCYDLDERFRATLVLVCRSGTWQVVNL